MNIILHNQKILIGIVLATTLLVIFSFQLIKEPSNTLPKELIDVAVMPPKTLEGIYLFDHQEKEITTKNFSNQWSFVFFGFINCPDVCPATLSQLVQINKKIRLKKEYEDNLQIFFVSIDPKRDSSKKLAEFVANFDSSFIALRGNEKNINFFENQLKAFHRIDENGSNDFYSVKHSADIFLIDPEGRLAARFTPPMNLDLVVEQFQLFVERYTKPIS